jgi:hypothetical protein
MSEYQPEKPAFASLSPDETHYYSFFLYGAKSSFIHKYLPEGSMYVGHFTDRRLIIEPWKMPGFVGVIADVVKVVTTSLSPSDGVDLIIKGMAKQAKDSLARTTFMADNRLYWSIEYKDIDNFELLGNLFFKNAFVRVATNVPSDKDAFVFQAAKITNQAKKGLGGEFGLKSNTNFCMLGSQLLEKYREKSISTSTQGSSPASSISSNFKTSVNFKEQFKQVGNSRNHLSQGDIIERFRTYEEYLTWFNQKPGIASHPLSEEQFYRSIRYQ